MNDKYIANATEFNRMARQNASWPMWEDNQGRSYIQWPEEELPEDLQDWKARSFTQIHGHTELCLVLYRLPRAKRSPETQAAGDGWFVGTDQVVGHPSLMSGSDEFIYLYRRQDRVEEVGIVHHIQTKRHTARSMTGAMIIEL